MSEQTLTGEIVGFAVKFYTEEGNWDWVYNNTPIFFLRDPTNFPLFIHTQKRNPQTNLKDATMFWDYLSTHPESIHQVLHLFSDRGTPYSYRFMNGYSGHTHKFVKPDGSFVYVQIHLKTDQGSKTMTNEEAGKMASENPDFSTQDLFEAIQRGEHPSWTVYVQVLTPEQAQKFKWNIFDLTKVWPHGDYPLHEVGRMTLNRNVTDYHAQIEQAAFEPNNIVPGTGLSPDKMLLARGFSYSDAHRARLGVNYKQIPVNEPKVEVHSYSKDGAMRIHNAGDPVYAPNSMGGPQADPKRAAEVRWYAYGEMVRSAYTLRPDDSDWGQPGTLVREVLDDEARDRLAHNIIGHVSKGVREPVLSRVFQYWTNVDPDLGKKVEEGVRANTNTNGK